MSPSDPPSLSSGVPHLDWLLGGGLPARRCLLVTGLPGTGKSILVSQLAFSLASRGHSTVIATATGEVHSRKLESLHGFTFFEREKLGREVVLLSAEAWLRKGGRELRDMLLSSVRERKARLLVLDGLWSLAEAWQDASRLREFLGDLAAGLVSCDCTCILVDERAPAEALLRPEASVVDGVLGMTVEAEGVERLRHIEVLKLRGRFSVPGPHGLTMGPEGLAVVPRLEMFEQGEPEGLRPEERLPTGVAGLDTLLGGGLPAGAVVLVSGPARTGKSLLGAAFAAAQPGPALHLLLHETEETFVTRAEAAGIPLGSARAAGRWAALALPETELDADAAVLALLERAREFGARRVVVDGLEALGRAVRPRSRLRSFAAALVRTCRARGLGALFTVAPEDCEEGGALARWMRVDARLSLGSSLRPGAREWPLLVEQVPGAMPQSEELVLRVSAAGVEVEGPPGPASRGGGVRMGGTFLQGEQQ